METTQHTQGLMSEKEKDAKRWDFPSFERRMVARLSKIRQRKEGSSENFWARYTSQKTLEFS